jgi:hypothetical protein
MGIETPKQLCLLSMMQDMMPVTWMKATQRSPTPSPTVRIINRSIDVKSTIGAKQSSSVVVPLYPPLPATGCDSTRANGCGE